MADSASLELTIELADRVVGGTLWLPSSTDEPVPLVIAGHGLTRSRRGLFPASLPNEFAKRGMASVAIDAPEHGDRAQCDDPEEIAAAWRRHWQKHGASMIAEELSRAIDQVGEQEGVDTSRIGYWGLSLGTQYGLGFVASTDRVRAAVLGLFGMPHIAPRMSEFVAHVHCPVFFIAQRDDEIHPLDRAQALFEAIASKDKELIVSDGGHMNVPSPVLKRSYDFLAERLRD